MLLTGCELATNVIISKIHRVYVDSYPHLSTDRQKSCG